MRIRSPWSLVMRVRSVSVSIMMRVRTVVLVVVPVRTAPSFQSRPTTLLHACIIMVVVIVVGTIIQHHKEDESHKAREEARLDNTSLFLALCICCLLGHLGHFHQRYLIVFVHGHNVLHGNSHIGRGGRILHGSGIALL